MTAPILSVAVRHVRPGPAALELPVYMSAGAAGMDLRADLTANVTLTPGARVLVPTGIAVAIPSGFEAQVRPRSGLAARYGLTVPNAPGTIDADFRGEIQVLLANQGQGPFTIRRGDRIAQLIVAPVVRVVWQLVATLEDSARGDGGFGSTDGG